MLGDDWFGLCYLHTLFWFIINAVNTPGVEDVLPAERPHDDVGTFQISWTSRLGLSLGKSYFLSHNLTVLTVNLPGGWILNQQNTRQLIQLWGAKFNIRYMNNDLLNLTLTLLDFLFEEEGVQIRGYFNPILSDIWYTIVHGAL